MRLTIQAPGAQLATVGALIILAWMPWTQARAQESIDLREVETVERVVILGSHASASLAPAGRFPSAIERPELQLHGRRDIARATADLLSAAQPVPGMDSFLHPGAEQASWLDIHGLGPGRTLVLVDGHRFGAFPASLPGWKDAAASPAEFPASALAGVQLLPSGASSLYGSGAMGGVVNLVTRQAFTGVEVGFINSDAAETEAVQRTDIVFGIGRSKANFMLAWEESTQPELAMLDREWARNFQALADSDPYVYSQGNGAPGSLVFEGHQIDLFLGDETSCRPEQTMVDPDDPDGEDMITIPALLCGEQERVYTGMRPLTDYLPDGQTSLEIADLFCEQLRGKLEGTQCRHRFGDDLMLAHRKDDQRLFLNYTHELGLGTEMRVQYSYNTSNIPVVRGVAQRTPLNPRWREWQIPLSNFAILPFLLEFREDETNEDCIRVACNLIDQLGLFQRDYLPEASFFLSGLENPAMATTEEQERAQALADNLRMAYDAEQSPVLFPTWSVLLANFNTTDPSLTDRYWGTSEDNFGPDARLTYKGNVLGGAGSSLAGSRRQRHQRYAWDMQGQLGVSGVFYRAGAVLESAHSTTIERDLLVQHLDRALRGYGASSCDYETAVQADAVRDDDSRTEPSAAAIGAGRGGGCFYVLPFGRGLVAWDDPTYSLTSGVARVEPLNSFPYGAFLQNWLFGDYNIDREQRNAQINMVFEGGSPGRTFSWAAGAEYRHQYFSLEPQGLANAATHPCDILVPIPEGTFGEGDDQIAYSDLKVDGDALKSQLDSDSCLPPVGPFAHLPSITGRKATRDLFSAFTDLHFAFGALDFQLSGRVDAADDAGTEFAPGLAVNWQLSRGLSLNLDTGQSFRFPSLIQRADLDHEAVWLDALNEYILAQSLPASEELETETSEHLSLGVRLAGQHSSLSLRYWSHQLANPIVQDPLQLMAYALVDGSSDPKVFDVTSRVLDPFACDSLGLPTGSRCPAEVLLRTGVQLHYRNGPAVDAAGWNLQWGYSLPTSKGVFGLSLDLDWLQQYQVDDFILVEDVLTPAFDAAGLHNYGHPFGSLPELRAVLQLDWRLGQHHVRLLNRHTSAYTDRRPDQRQTDYEIAAWDRFDFSYVYELPSRKLELKLDVTNLLDRDPPMVRTPLGYDTTQHDPYGRVIRLGVVLSYP